MILAREEVRDKFVVTAKNRNGLSFQGEVSRRHQLKVAKIPSP